MADQAPDTAYPWIPETVTRDQLRQVCEVLGLDWERVSTIRLDPKRASFTVLPPGATVLVDLLYQVTP